MVRRSVVDEDQLMCVAEYDLVKSRQEGLYVPLLVMHRNNKRNTWLLFSHLVAELGVEPSLKGYEPFVRRTLLRTDECSIPLRVTVWKLKAEVLQIALVYE